MKAFLTRWLITTVAVAVAVKLTGMQADSWTALIGTALLKSPLGIRRTLDLFSQALQKNALTTREPTGQLS